jgi:hypothetical protein
MALYRGTFGPLTNRQTLRLMRGLIEDWLEELQGEMLSIQETTRQNISFPTCEMSCLFAIATERAGEFPSGLYGIERIA